MPSALVRLSRACAGPVLLFAITSGFFWKLTLSNRYTWLNSPDMANQVLPWLDFQARSFHQHSFPLWDPHLWAGQSLIGQLQPGTAYPPNWLLFSLPLEQGHIRLTCLHWYWVLIHYFAALFCYWLCRDLKRSRVASVLAGALFGLGGFLGRTEWPQHLNSVIWAPLVLLFFLRAVRGQRPARSAALSGTLLGVCFLGGHFQGPTFLALAMALLWGVFLVRQPRLAGPAALFALFCFLAGAMQTLPAIEYGRLAVRWAGLPGGEPLRWDQVVPYPVHAGYSFQPASLLGIAVSGVFAPSCPFAGVVALVLGLLAWRAAAGGARETGVFAAIAALGIALALGGNSILHGVAYAALPMLEKARNPSMAIFLLHFGMSVLVAYGFDSLPGPQGTRLVRRVLLATAGFMAAALGMVWALRVETSPDIRAGVAAVAAAALAAVLWLWERARISRRVAGALLLAFMLFELSHEGGFYLPLRDGPPYLATLREQADVAAFLSRQPGLPRADLDDEDVPCNFGDWYGVDQAGGYVASVPEPTYRRIGESKVRALLGIEYRVSRKPAPEGFTTPVFTSASGLKIYRNPGVMPRVWVTHQAIPVPDRRDIAPALYRSGFDPRVQVLLPGAAPQLEECAGDTVRTMRRTPNSFTVGVEMHCRGVVIVADPYAPGWKARLDGAPAEILEAYGLIRGVVVPSGRHTIQMEYRPASVIWGAALSAAGILLPVFLYPFKSRKASSISRLASGEGGVSGRRGGPP